MAAVLCPTWASVIALSALLIVPHNKVSFPIDAACSGAGPALHMHIDSCKSVAAEIY
jgi:hypothetical protein